MPNIKWINVKVYFEKCLLLTSSVKKINWNYKKENTVS